MARDHFVYWNDAKPTTEEVQYVCEDFIESLGAVAWSEEGGRFVLTLFGTYSSPLARINGGKYDRPPEPGFDERVIEVFPGDEALDVITREQDSVTNSIAEGLAAVFARVWRGRLEMG